jgi:ankyrin repeat protein
VKQIYEGRIALTRLLLEHGADIRAEDNKGRTASQVASEEDDDEMMQLLSEPSPTLTEVRLRASTTSTDINPCFNFSVSTRSDTLRV